MSKTVPDNPAPTTLPAANLRPGMHIRSLDYVTTVTGTRAVDTIGEVRYTLPYTDPDGTPRIAVMATRVRTGQPWELRYLADEPVTLATDEQIAEMSAAQRREALADELRRLADDIVRLRLPLPRWGVSFRGCLDGRDELEAWAEHLGVSAAVNGPKDRIPSVDAELGRSPGWYGALLEVHMQSEPEPEPVEMLTPAEWAERDGVTVLDADGWPDQESWERPIWRPEWERRLARSTVQMRTAAGVLEARLPEPVTVDGGPDDEADDDLCPDPWHEQSTVPTEACPACGDPAPVVAPTSTYSPAVVAAIGNHLAAEPTAPAEPLSLTPDPAPTNPADWTDYAKRLDRARPDWWREPRVGMAAPLRAMAGLRLRGGAAAQAAGLSGSDAER